LTLKPDVSDSYESTINTKLSLIFWNDILSWTRSSSLITMKITNLKLPFIIGITLTKLNIESFYTVNRFESKEKLITLQSKQMMNRWTDNLIVSYFELNWNAVYFIIGNVFILLFFLRNKALCTFILKCSSKRRKISRGPLYLQCQRGKGICRILNSCWLKNAPLAGLTIGAQRKCCLQYLHRFIFVQCEVYVEIILTLS